MYIPLAGNIFNPNMHLSSIQNDISLYWIAENVELAAILDFLLEFFSIYSIEFLKLYRIAIGMIASCSNLFSTIWTIENATLP